jgi:uncharacterized protein (TIGR02594 family)
MDIPAQYKWLENEPGPGMIVEALKLFGTQEVLGEKNNPVILSWASEVGGNVKQVYLADKIPWCGLFMAIVAKRSGNEIVKDPLWALNWGTFGNFANQPMLGDVLAFVRQTADGKKAGHVALYIGEDDKAYHTLGGNQSDCVCLTRMAKTRLYAARRPNYTTIPPNLRKIFLASNGQLSQNEG